MSYENRKREYERLVNLGREKDIPQSLIDEFGKIKKSKDDIKKKEKEKNGK